MSGSDKTSLGDRMKFYEKRYSPTVLPMLPILARIDGRSFSKFTQGLARPYDGRMSRLMIDATKFLVEQTNARCGYTQSDEITLVWLAEDPDAELFFGGKLLKMTSVVGSLATAYFNKIMPERLPEKAKLMPVFDNRVWEVPVAYEAVNCFIWREQDAVRNSIQSAARAHFSHSECENKNGSELQEMLWQKGINWNDYPTFFKRGTYVRRRILERSFTEEELKALPPKHAAIKDPDLVVRRSVVMEEDFPPLTKIANRNEVILMGDDPIMQS
jgi:tRNA(His) guanylyltransferase